MGVGGLTRSGKEEGAHVSSQLDRFGSAKQAQTVRGKKGNKRDGLTGFCRSALRCHPRPVVNYWTKKQRCFAERPPPGILECGRSKNGVKGRYTQPKGWQQGPKRVTPSKTLTAPIGGDWRRKFKRGEGEQNHREKRDLQSLQRKRSKNVLFQPWKGITVADD